MIFEDSWHYSAGFLPEGQFVNVAENENLIAEPMLFEMPFFGLAPRDYSLQKQQPLVHRNGFKEITKLSLGRPGAMNNLSPSMEKVLNKSIVTVSEGREYQVVLEFDQGQIGKTKAFDPLIPLVFKW